MPHSPGPWQMDEVRTDSGRAFRVGTGEMLRAGKGCCIIYDDHPGAQENERKANARLIAAAPALLHACREAADLLAAQHQNLTNGVWDDADAQNTVELIENVIRQATLPKQQ